MRLRHMAAINAEVQGKVRRHHVESFDHDYQMALVALFEAGRLQAAKKPMTPAERRKLLTSTPKAKRPKK